MIYRLALALGYASPRRMLGEMTQEELCHWFAYFETEPFGTVADDVRCGILGAAAAGAMGAKVKPRDFMPSWSHRAPQQKSHAELKAKVALLKKVWQKKKPKPKAN